MTRTDEGLNDSEFELYQRLIYDTCGINLNNTKKQLLESRLSKRRQLHGMSFRQYREFLMSDKSGVEMAEMIDAVTTNKTDFFRENTHFEFLQKEVFPDLIRQSQVRFWSSACSSGEEPYTLAMTLMESPFPVNSDIKILATDISNKVLDMAEAGVYAADKISAVPMALRRKYFLQGTGQWEGCYLVKDELRSFIRFRRMNLMEPFPLKALFDVIFCRNVMIYFDKPTQERLIQKLANQLRPGGYLLIGHSETLSGISSSLKYIQPSIYRK
ncbi:MAG: protein-glutamate O-methyltransferase [SAR324 cluster bacterium]|nr:protein-glutamate O-methyltransferase [SAR324 cluster bacterium]